jgi:hypothetical protein
MTSFEVAEVKRQLAEYYGLTEVWLVYKGRKLGERELVQQIGLDNYSKVFLGESRIPSPSTLGRDSPETSTPMLSGNPLAGVLANEPEMLLELLQMNPRMKAMMERNPQIRHALSDPSTLKEILEQGRNPRAYQEAMRGHDRALSNIEMLPGGFQALQQFYTQELAEVEAMGGTALKGVEYEGRKTRNTEQMPNPWRSNPGNESTSKRIPITAGDSSMNELSTPDVSDLASYEVTFATQLTAMQEMGFTDQSENIRALLATGGNVDSAIERILNKRI